jgi:hypothetical protein
LKSALIVWLYNVSQYGVRHEHNQEISRRVVFSNVIFISLPLVYLLFMLLDYQSFLNLFNTFKFDQYVVPIIMAICVFCIGLNYLNYTLLSRLIFIISWPLLLHLIPIFIHHSPIDYTIAFPMGIIFHSLIIQLVFSHSKEKLLFWTAILLNFITLIYASDILIYASDGQHSLIQLLTNSYYLLDIILYWLLFNLVMFYVILVIEAYINKVDKSYTIVNFQKKELKKFNQSLEKKVALRTSELMLQNEKLRSYAYFNAHELKGPFCRIKGLLYLKSLDKLTTDDNVQINKRIDFDIIELEKTITKIQHLVNED